MRDLDVGRSFWAFVTTIPLTLLTIVSFAALRELQGAVRAWWLIAAVVTCAERLFTFAFFIPGAVRLMQPERETAARINRIATRWRSLNYVRAAMTLIGWLCALKALSSGR
jgi:hypothetical protein